MMSAEQEASRATAAQGLGGAHCGACYGKAGLSRHRLDGALLLDESFDAGHWQHLQIDLLAIR